MRLIKSGDVPLTPIKIGPRAIRFHRDDVAQWLSAQRPACRRLKSWLPRAIDLPPGDPHAAAVNTRRFARKAITTTPFCRLCNRAGRREHTFAPPD